TPSDGVALGTAVQSLPVSIVNTAPVIDSVTITPAGPTTKQILTANIASHDDDGDTLSYSYIWKKNGAAISGQTASTLDLSIAANGEKGASTPDSVPPTDGTPSGPPTQSSAVIVLNTTPISDSVTITPASPTTKHLLTATVTSNDDDGN